MRRERKARGKLRKGVFRRGEVYLFTCRPGENAIVESIEGNGTMVGTGAANEPGVYTVIKNCLKLRRTSTCPVLLEEKEHGSGFGNRIHFSRGEHAPAVPISRGVERTDVG